MSLYTKYRPKDFDNLVGQDFIKETLKRAIAEDKTVGAYLFCGPRGTGKTSTARLFAKTINCLNPKDGNPCLVCENCKNFAEDKLIDIIEIDAASHTGVDNIREIIEKAQFAPTKTKYKIYIIDEVHMLSKGAFNALLKILEEPPKHVKFILATTETHKVPETIISRCQRYDFKRIDDKNIIDRLLFIAKEENIKIDEKSLNYIVSSCNGGLRNAISLFEQLIENNEITYEKIIEKLGISSSDEFEKIIEKMLNKDISLIYDFDNLVESGKNLKLFFKELIFKIKEKLILEIKAGNNISNLINIFDILDETYTKTKNSLDENTTFLIGILKIIGNVEKNDDNTVTINEKPKQEKPKIIEQKPVKQEPKIEDFDLDEIFGEEENEVLNTKKEESKEKEVNGNFNSSDFIQKVKEKGAKGALTMALRGSQIALLEDSLEITPNTKFVRTHIENPESRQFMHDVLEEMGFKDFKIIVK